MRLHPSIVLVLAFCTPLITAFNTTRPSPSNAKDDTVQCIYPISGQYGLLPRLLYYGSLTFAILNRRQQWLVVGALASALAFAGSSAIHAIALIKSRRKIFDLDIIATWSILSTGSLAYITLVHWSSTLRHSRARLVMILWGSLCSIGLIFARASMFDASTESEAACRAADGSLLTSPLELQSPRFNCSYHCFSISKPMRERAETIAIPTHVMTDKYSSLQLIMVGPVMFAAYASLSAQLRPHTPSQIYMLAVFSIIMKPSSREELTKAIYNAASETWYGGYMVYLRFVPRDKCLWRKLLYSMLIPWLAIEFFMDVLSPVLLTGNIILNELRVLGPGLPTNEAAFAIGQWGPVVSAVLVVIAAIVNKSKDEWAARKKLKVADIPRHSATESTAWDVELGDMDGQVNGVVKQNLNQETLRSMGGDMPASRRDGSGLVRDS